jgi:hypothetical protein
LRKNLLLSGNIIVDRPAPELTGIFMAQKGILSTSHYIPITYSILPGKILPLTTCSVLLIFHSPALNLEQLLCHAGNASRSGNMVNVTTE